MKLKEKSFKYSSDLVRWVNDNRTIQIIAITSSGKFSEGFTLFYKEPGNQQS